MTITTATGLSIDKTATLLQNLIDLRTQTDIALPSIIEECVAGLLDEQSIFARQIDEYMHCKKRDVNEVEIVKVIIDTCPGFMATKDTRGRLPVHCSALDHSSSSTFVPLLAYAGRQHGIGGTDGRGGLVEKSHGNANLLQYMSRDPSPDTYKALMSTELPLFVKQDVHDYHLLHSAVHGGHIEMIKFLVKLDASCLYSFNSLHIMPIEMLVLPIRGTKQTQLEILRYLLKSAVTHDVHHPSIGGLFNTSVGNGRSVLDSIIKRHGKEEVWDCIEEVLLRFDNLPILHQTIIHAPQHCMAVMTHLPDSVLARDHRNRLPIHVALASGMSWSTDLVAIINANRPHLEENDPVTNLPPFALAAMEDSCGLKTAYYLLMKNPELAKKIGITDLLESSPEQNSKGMKRKMNEL